MVKLEPYYLMVNGVQLLTIYIGLPRIIQKSLMMIVSKDFLRIVVTTIVLYLVFLDSMQVINKSKSKEKLLKIKS